MNNKIFIFMFFFFIMFSYNAYSCGCGIALESMEVFNQLKETQAYLLIDVTGPNEYVEMPFFRMISIEEPQDVTIVFPIDQIPYDVQGKTITAGDFLNTYQISNAELFMERQSVLGVVKKVGYDIKDMSGFVNILANGLPGIFVAGMSMNRFGSADYENGLLARYEFEGGAMEIYDIDSMDTLNSLVEKLNLTASGKVEELINKYNDYYVAVLYLKVNSALDANSLQVLKTQCPDKFEEIKKLLQEKESFTQRDIYNLARESVCREEIYKLMNVVTGISDEVKGTLVQMYFKDTNKFFYPTSVVNSYKYPVSEQKYFIKTPKELHAKLESSKISNTGLLDNERWYKITSTEEDLKGSIVEVPFSVRAGDTLRSIFQFLWKISIVFAIFVYIMVIIISFVLIKGDEEWLTKDIIIAVLVSIFGGLIISSIVMFARDKKRFGWILLCIWASFIVLAIISNALL